MNAPEWSLEELIELHRLFIEMRQRASADDRRDLSFRLVSSHASTVRLEHAANECASCPAGLRADLVQEATLLLVETFSAESLHYTDQGAHEFGSWYLAACGYACGHAARRLPGNGSNLIAFVDTQKLSQVIASPETHEHAFDKLARVFAQLSEGPVKKVMLDWMAGMRVDASACRRSISPSSVDRLRQRGRRLLRELWDRDGTDDDPGW